MVNAPLALVCRTLREQRSHSTQRQQAHVGFQGWNTNGETLPVAAWIDYCITETQLRPCCVLCSTVINSKFANVLD